jgi:signal transduction histidine kinase
MSLLRRTILVGFLSGIAALSVGVPLAAAAAAAQSAPAPQVRKRILVLHDENKDDLPGLARTDRSLRDAFRAELGSTVEIHSESMGLSRFPRPGYDSLVAHFLRTKYANLPIDLIVAVMEPPLDFLLRHAATMFPGVPMVFASIDASMLEGKTLPANVTGVLVKRTYSPTLEVVLRLQPETRNIFVVGGASAFDRFLQTFVRRDLRPFEDRVQINYLFGMSMDALLTRLSSLPAHSVILYISMLADGAGRRFVPAEALTSIAATGSAPVYVFLDQYVGLGAVGGNVYSFVTHGAHVAALGLQILRGASPASLPIRELGSQVNLFDARELKRWNLDEARLPPGSVILNQDPSVWARYRWFILVAIAVLATQGALIAGLLLARARQQRAEAEARRHRDDLAHVLRVTSLSELTSSLAHEIAQPLTAIVTNARAATRLLEGGRPSDVKEVADALADITADARHASLVIDRVRTLFRREHTEHVAVDVKTLIEEAVRLLHAAMLIGRIDIRLESADAVPAVSGDAVQLEQVLLNVLMNAADAIAASRNGARVITIRARQHRPRHVTIEVTDTGIGVAEAELEHIFDHFVTTKLKGLGMGLAISRSIVTAHGGSIWATANTGGGLTVHIELPTSSEARSGEETRRKAELPE